MLLILRFITRFSRFFFVSTACANANLPAMTPRPQSPDSQPVTDSTKNTATSLRKRPLASPKSTTGKAKKDSPIHESLTEDKYRFTPERDTWNGKYEFGGPIGALGFIVFSHFIMYYLWACICFFDGEAVYPGHAKLQGKPFWSTFMAAIAERAAPTAWTFGVFSAFLFFEYALAVVLPGPVTYGLPLASEGGRRLAYKCNAVSAWYIQLAVIIALEYTGIFSLAQVADNFGRFMTAAVIWGDVVSVIVYIWGFATNRAFRNSGNHLYDFFMGSMLNPRLPGDVDLKLVAELRNSWALLFYLTAASAVQMYRDTGYITTNMALLALAQFLYTNACQKGEECVPTTWDIHYEKFGWMLVFWNFAGVPFVYCFQSLFIKQVVPTLNYGPFHTAFLLVFILTVYWIWDTVNSQKNRFRMKRQGVDEAIIRRKTFPQLPWGYIEDPHTLKSDRGELFVDGWYKYARKMHYTADMCMSFYWGYCCGVTHFIPFFYFCFFFSHLIHRVQRDEERCAEKYGPLWKQYVKEVPYRFIPGVF